MHLYFLCKSLMSDYTGNQWVESKFCGPKSCKTLLLQKINILLTKDLMHILVHCMLKENSMHTEAVKRMMEDVAWLVRSDIIF